MQLVLPFLTLNGVPLLQATTSALHVELCFSPSIRVSHQVTNAYHKLVLRSRYVVTMKSVGEKKAQVIIISLPWLHPIKGCRHVPFFLISPPRLLGNGSGTTLPKMPHCRLRLQLSNPPESAAMHQESVFWAHNRAWRPHWLGILWG